MNVKKRILAVLLASLLIIALFAACNASPTTSGGATTTPTATPTPTAGGDEEDPGLVESPVDTDPYTFTFFHNYFWVDNYMWGSDTASAAWAEKFNITVEFTKPDAGGNDRLNLMITTDDLPDVIQMEREALYVQICRLGKFVDLEPLMNDTNKFRDLFNASTLDFLKIDGTLYGIPHWARKNATGGNNAWMYTTKIYEAAGSPEIKTVTDLYNYAIWARDNYTSNSAGKVYPMAFVAEDNAAAYTLQAFYRASGGPNTAALYTAAIDGKIQSFFRDPVAQAALLEANKWWRDGLIAPDQYTMTGEQLRERLSTGRIALAYYDQSDTDTNKWRNILRTDDPGNSWEIFTNPVYPPMEGTSADAVMGDQYTTTGWNSTMITTAAEKPQRIFDLLSYILSKEGSIEMMYGAQGDWWDELDANGNPILKQAESEMTEEELRRIGSWTWQMLPAHADNVDSTKFAVNAALPADQQSWVVNNQSNILTPTMGVTDEYNNFGVLIDGTSDLGIANALCQEYVKQNFSKIIMANSAAECQTMIDNLIKYLDDNRFQEVEAILTAEWEKNCAVQGGSVFK